MPPELNTIAHWAARVMEMGGIAIVVLGALLATFQFLRDAPGRKRFGDAYHRYRTHLGRSILLGLEFLVAADIIGTVAVDPTFRNLGVLGLVVLIRTFLSFSLEVEINGHWPWQASEKKGSPGREPL